MTMEMKIRFAFEGRGEASIHILTMEREANAWILKGLDPWVRSSPW